MSADPNHLYIEPKLTSINHLEILLWSWDNSIMAPIELMALTDMKVAQFLYNMIYLA